MSSSLDAAESGAVRTDTVLEAVEFPAGVAHLDAGLADVYGDDLPHLESSVCTPRSNYNVLRGSISAVLCSKKALENAPRLRPISAWGGGLPKGLPIDSLATVKQRESIRFAVARTDLRAFHFLHIASQGRNGLENRRVFVLELQIQRAQ